TTAARRARRSAPTCVSTAASTACSWSLRRARRSRPTARRSSCAESARRGGSGRNRLGLLDAPRQQRFARDDEALDLRGALVELHDLRVAEELLDGVLLDEAVAA